MPVLNDTYDFGRDAPGSVKAAFENQTAKRHLFSQGTELYKFTEFEMFQPDAQGNRGVGARVSPWWCSVLPLSTDDLGLDGLIAAARQANKSALEFAREWLAVKYSWNALASSQLGLAKVQRIRLLKPIYGFFGKVQRQANDKVPLHKPGRTGGRASLMGGGTQIFIPGLTAEHFLQVAVLLLS
jgi:hypothetical protein